VARKAHIVNWQQRAREFAVGDECFPFEFGNEYGSGRVVAVYPAIGMVDVEFPSGTKRFPVEDLQRTVTEVHPPVTEQVPGGIPEHGVSGGPPPKATQPLREDPTAKTASVQRVAQAFVKKSLYWASKDRKYRPAQSELDSNSFTCPKCKEEQLRPAIYKRREGNSERLLGCGRCLFLIKTCDIMGHPDYEDEVG